MRQTTSVTNVGSSAVLSLDPRQAPFSVGFAAVVSSGTPTYSVEYTYDDVQASSPTPVWYTHTAASGATTNKDGAITSPCAAVRVTISSGSGTVRLVVLQGLR